MSKFKDHKRLNKRLKKIKCTARQGQGPKADEAAHRLVLLDDCKSTCCGKKYSKRCKHCPRNAADAIFTPLKVHVEHMPAMSA